MARIILGSYMVRYPLGGMMSWVLQYLVGFQRLGHDVYFVEKGGYPNSCYDPRNDVMGDDCSYGTQVVEATLRRFGLDRSWCFVDAEGIYHGLARDEIERVFDSADVFIDMGTHGAWLQEAHGTTTALVDGEPGFTQMKMQKRVDAGEELFSYDTYFTTGRNLGTSESTAPTAGRQWHHLFHPVVPQLFQTPRAPQDGSFTTVMNWRSYEPLEYAGRTYGHKDVEFERFIDLPSMIPVPLEIAVSGMDVPTEMLESRGWIVRDAHDVTMSVDAFSSYISSSLGEFSICKNGFVATRSGWFSDRAAAYLAGGRPVVMQDTGFSSHLPCGEGLFAVQSLEDAADAIDKILTDYNAHSSAARDVANESLEASKVLGGMLAEVGIGGARTHR